MESQHEQVLNARNTLRELRREARWLRRLAMVFLFADVIGVIALLIYGQWVPFL